MKKLLLLLSAFIVFAVNAQERTISKTFTENNTYYKYTGTTSDILNGSTIDTITFVITLNKPYPIFDIYTKTWFELVGTADTTIACKLYGKVFSGDTYTLLSTASFSGSANAGVVLSTLNIPVETIVYDTTAISVDSIGYYSASILRASVYQNYRYLQLQYIIAGNDNTGTGSYIDAIEFKIPGQ